MEQNLAEQNLTNYEIMSKLKGMTLSIEIKPLPESKIKIAFHRYYLEQFFDAKILLNQFADGLFCLTANAALDVLTFKRGEFDSVISLVVSKNEILCCNPISN